VNVQLIAASDGDRARIEALYDYYVYDFSEILGFDVADDGRFHAPSIAAFFEEPEHHAFVIRVDGALAGFALVVETSRLTGERGVRDVAEFFVLRRYRRHGVGDRAACALFDRFVGRWEVRQKRENVGAIAFWRRVTARYTNGRFDEVTLDDERWRGTVQRFITVREA
jgi:predicted acetyltransferase